MIYYLTFFVVGALSECPKMDQVPVMYDKNSKINKLLLWKSKIEKNHLIHFGAILKWRQIFGGEGGLWKPDFIWQGGSGGYLISDVR